MELAALLVAQELATAFRGEHEMNHDVGEGLGHGGDGLWLRTNVHIGDEGIIQETVWSFNSPLTFASVGL